MCRNRRPSCFALQSSPEGWQATSLLERCREHADRQGARGAAARAVPGRDQRHAGVGVAALNRGARGRRHATADAVAVAEDHGAGVLADTSIVHVKLSQLQLRRPRQWGACWLALMLWRELRLDQFSSKRLGVSRKGTRWDQVLFVLVAYRLLAPGSEWRLHREWFQRSAVADLLGQDAGLAEIHKLYRCHDRLLAHKQAGLRSPGGTVARSVQHQLRRAALRSRRAPISRRIHRSRKATSAASGTRAIIDPIVCRSSLPWW